MAELLDRLARVARGAQFCAGLNPAQWEALRYLARANKYSRSPGALADYLGATPGTVSQTLIVLETKGYVRRARDLSDRRSVNLALTEAGQAVLLQDPLTALGACVVGLNGDERAALSRAVDQVLTSLQSARSVCGFGLCRDCSHLRPGEGNVAGQGNPADSGHSCRCGVTGEGLAVDELKQICVDFRR